MYTLSNFTAAQGLVSNEVSHLDIRVKVGTVFLAGQPVIKSTDDKCHVAHIHV